MASHLTVAEAIEQAATEYERGLDEIEHAVSLGAAVPRVTIGIVVEACAYVAHAAEAIRATRNTAKEIARWADIADRANALRVRLGGTVH